MYCTLYSGRWYWSLWLPCWHRLFNVCFGGCQFFANSLNFWDWFEFFSRLLCIEIFLDLIFPTIEPTLVLVVVWHSLYHLDPDYLMALRLLVLTTYHLNELANTALRQDFFELLLQGH